MGKNIVICCDGTGNQYGDHNTNVVKLYSVLRRDPSAKVAFYDPGVGTFNVHPALTRTAKRVLRILGLGFGLGMTRNILDAYKFIMQNYEKGDRIFLFGFSRGAYTARAVAGMIHKCGLLYPNNDNLLPYAVQMFKREEKREIYNGFKRTFSRECPIHFLGLWDTVNSVGWVWDPLMLPFTTNNQDVSVIRHAVSIDERRAFFKQNLWGKGIKNANVKQVWFAGVHSDIGGSYPQNESGLSNIALEWMIVEAVKNGLKIVESLANEVLSNPVRDHRAQIHKSLRLGWWPAEFWPKLVSVPPDKFSRKSDNHDKWSKKLRFNLGRRRWIENNTLIHESVLNRIKDVPEYNPSNLPESYRTESWRKLKNVLNTNGANGRRKPEPIHTS